MGETDRSSKTTLEAATLFIEEKQQQLQAVFTLFDNRPPVVSSARSNGRSRSSQPESFRGRASDHGQAAQTWLYDYSCTLKLSLLTILLPKLLQDDARLWWQQVGHALMPICPTLDDLAEYPSALRKPW